MTSLFINLATYARAQLDYLTEGSKMPLDTYLSNVPRSKNGVHIQRGLGTNTKVPGPQRPKTYVVPHMYMQS